MSPRRVHRGSWAFVAALFITVLVPRATYAIAPGTLIRASQPAVYSVGSDGKRYAFSNEKAYRTWYGDFSRVQRVSDTALAAIPLGGVVHYRPGMRLVKVATDPKVYAVDRGGALRWVRTEAIARALYGATWHGAVDDLPVEFFSHYTIGSPIDGHDDYDPERIQRSITAIDENRRTAGGLEPPAPSPRPSPTVTTSIPPCTGQKLTRTPVAFEALESITPLGNLSPRLGGGHILPTDHTYWHFPDGQRGTWYLEPLVAPGDITVTMIRSNLDRDESRTDGSDEYAIHFKLCEEVEGIFGHVKTIVPKLQQAIAGGTCIPNWIGGCAHEVSVRVAAGEQIGEIGGGVFRGVDVGVYDTRVTLVFANPNRRLHDRERYAVCPFEYFDAATRAGIDAKLPVAVRGTCGAVMQDVPGTLAGGWSLGSVPDDTLTKPAEQLAFSYEAREPVRRVLSTGGQFGFVEHGAGFVIGPEQSSGRINRAYRDVTPDGNTYCFQGAAGSYSKMLVQLMSASELKIEYQKTQQLNAPDFFACTGDEQFVSPQMYRR